MTDAAGHKSRGPTPPREQSQELDGRAHLSEVDLIEKGDRKI